MEIIPGAIASKVFEIFAYFRRLSISMKTTILRFVPLAFIIIFLYSSCSPKPDDIIRPPIIVDTLPPNPPASTTCTDCGWEAEIDGVLFKGTIDTSFYRIDASAGDTIITLTGSGNNKMSNILLKMYINRRTHSGRGFGEFDTASSQKMIFSWGASSSINVQVDSLDLNNKVIGSFSGVGYLYDVNNAPHEVKNGKFKFRLGATNNVPKFFTYVSPSRTIKGCLNRADFQSNSLVLEGIDFNGIGDERFKLIVHTGATIKPGVYKASKEQVMLNYYLPSLYFVYICEDGGDLTVTIDSVNGNIVKAHYSGSYIGQPVSGYFTCRVKNYQPYPDAVNKWTYLDEHLPSFTANIYGGNILNASKVVNGNRHVLTVNGESDQSLSTFKLVISSSNPIDTGTYYTVYTNVAPYRNLDSVYFKTSTSTVLNYGYGYSYEAKCIIDSIDNNRVVGRFNFIIPSAQTYKQGRFRAHF